MSFAPQGVSPFLPGNNYMKINHGVKKDVDRSLILRKKNNKVNYKKCSDVELLEHLEKNEKLLINKALIDKLPDKGEKIIQKNKEIKEEIARRNIIIENKEKEEKVTKENTSSDNENNTENVNNTKDTTTENAETTENNKNNTNNNNNNSNSNDNDNDNDNDNSKQHEMEIDSINQKLQSIRISENKNDGTKPKRGQARVAEMILKDSTLSNPTFMIPHKPNKSHSKVISIEESLEIQRNQRKLQKKLETQEALLRLKASAMSTGPVNYHSNEYRDTKNEFDDDDNDDDDDSDDDFDNHSFYDSDDAEADAFLFRNN